MERHLGSRDLFAMKEGGNPLRGEEDKSSELINQFHGKSGRRRGTFLSPGRFSVSSALDPKIRIYIFMQRSRVRGSSGRRRRNVDRTEDSL